MKEKWKEEKKKIGIDEDIKSKIEEERNEIEIEKRNGEFKKEGEIEYGKIKKMEKKIDDEESKEKKG